MLYFPLLLLSTAFWLYKFSKVLMSLATTIILYFIWYRGNNNYVGLSCLVQCKKLNSTTESLLPIIEENRSHSRHATVIVWSHHLALCVRQGLEVQTSALLGGGRQLVLASTVQSPHQSDYDHIMQSLTKETLAPLASYLESHDIAMLTTIWSHAWCT